MVERHNPVKRQDKGSIVHLAPPENPQEANDLLNFSQTAYTRLLGIL